MSITKNYKEGNKGSDFNFRSKILKGLQKISDNTGTSGKSPAQERTPSLTRATTGGTLVAGARSVSFLNSGADDVPTVLGSVLKQGESISFNAGGEDDTLSAIAYTVASGELLIAAIY